MSTVAVLQSNYVPWKGYFEIIRQSDVFVFYDDVQYTKNDWRNRNKIKTSNGLAWLTIPTGSSLDRLICEVELTDARWQRKHWKSLSQWYGKAPHFEAVRPMLEPVYVDTAWDTLSELNQHLIRLIATQVLGLQTEFRDSREFDLSGARCDRLLSLLDHLSPRTYLSGPSASSYLDTDAFDSAGIAIRYMDYSGYPEYPQRFPPFRHDVSILDLLFNVGPDHAADYIWGWRASA